MLRRLFCPLLAATVLATALGGVATPASAAIRVVINDGTNTRIFYSSDDATAYFTTTLGTYDIVVGTVITNFSTQSSSGGSLTQTLNVSDTIPGGTLPTLHVTTSVINAVGGVPNGEVSAGNQAAVLGAGLARFTLPASTQLVVGSDVDANSNLASGMVQNNTTVNGTTVSSLAIPIDGVNPPEAQQTGIVNNDPAQGYTLVSEIVLMVGSTGIMGSISANSSVTALTPEPGPLALWGLGAASIFVTAAGRRLRFLARA